MQVSWVLLVVALCVYASRVDAQCDCRPPALCPGAYRQVPVQQCFLPGRRLGVCCGQPSIPTFSGGGFQTGQGGFSFANVGVGGVGISLATGNLQQAKPSRIGGTRGPAGQSGCVPLVLCPPAAVSPGYLQSNGCQLGDGSLGIFCTFAGTQLAASGLQGRQPSGGGKFSSLDQLRPLTSDAIGRAGAPLALRAPTQQALFTAGQAGLQAVNTLTSTTSQLLNSGQVPNVNSPTALFFLNAQSSDLEQNLGMQGLQSIMALTNLQSQGGGGGGGGGGGIFGGGGGGGGGGSGGSFFPTTGAGQTSFFPATGAGQTSFSPATGAGQTSVQVPNCTPEGSIRCDNSIYRTLTGECNNLQRPRLGRALTGLKRLLPNTYDDNLFAIRTRAVRGGTLPSARLVSERVLDTLSNELNDFTLSLMQFSQFVDHDMSHALVFRLNSGNGIECCENNGQTFPTVPRHPQCIPIPIPADDPFYSQYGQRCMSLVRSLPSPLSDCIPRAVNPLNELSSFLDASNVYGSKQEDLNAIRAFQGGLMLTSQGQLLPLTGASVSDRPCRASICFRAGETRVNEQSGLAVMHTVFVREHNRIARGLKNVHPFWDDERLFQNARRIVAAEWQHILYNEWLPIVVGFDYADAHGLLPLQSGFSNYYDPNIDPSISNSFASAAFRFGHNMVRDMYDLIDANGQVFRTVNVSTTFFEPTVVAQSLAGHARTLVARRSETSDTNMAHAVHEMLFTTNFRFGLDLLSLNIQRGRDHGTPTHAQVLEACGIARVQFWGDLNRVMDSQVIDRLRSVYDDPRDVDLFIGGAIERRAPGAQVGPTFQCLVGQQFFDLRFGDRFFYDNGGFAHSFTPAQLAEIRKSSWARIMCDTLGPQFGNDFTRVQPLGFITTLGQNQVTQCNSLAIPTVDLGVF
ncbi:peroxidase-like [Pollicipes pollicipes]|uniref:peroxidase-like n=1 Tax=Pollicipes pollicipes TaxID=41117 RepID=UPI0018859DA1|nr:peroxidase-like [Pollicipes pollicipes]